MKDYMLRITAANGQIRGFFATTIETAEQARTRHKTTPVATAALGRTLTATAIMGAMLKNDKDVITVSFKGDGPLQSILATADCHGNVKGYVGEPRVILPLKKNGKLDVGGAIGKGFINVIKDMGLKEPVSGSIPLISGEIAEDITRYFSTSEQTPSVVSLGVLVDVDLTVKQAGGFIIQLMPGAEDANIDILEKNISRLDTVTNMMEKGLTPDRIMNVVLEGLNPVIHEKSGIRFLCNCSKERVESALKLVGKEELCDILENEKKANIHCHFCNTDYGFGEEELLAIYDSM